MCEHQLWTQVASKFCRCFSHFFATSRVTWEGFCANHNSTVAQRGKPGSPLYRRCFQAACDLSELLECGGRMITISISTLEAMFLFVWPIGFFKINKRWWWWWCCFILSGVQSFCGENAWDDRFGGVRLCCFFLFYGLLSFVLLLVWCVCVLSVVVDCCRVFCSVNVCCFGIWVWNFWDVVANGSWMRLNETMI